MNRSMMIISSAMAMLALGVAVPGAAPAGEDLLAPYEHDDREFTRVEIGDMVVYYHQRMVDEATVEGDYIVYQFDRHSEELLAKRVHWRDDLPARGVPQITREEAESLAPGTVQMSRLYLISPESAIFPLDPAPENPCWVVRSVVDGRLIVTIIDSMNGSVLGNGVPPPYKGFSLSGPIYFDPCSAAWTSWYQNAAYWFNAMGYPTEAVQWPTGGKVRSHVQSCSTAVFYELAHGGSSYFTNACTDGTSANEISTWIANHTKMPFTFIGSCEGMCSVGYGTFSYEFRKGSMENTVTVGYCHMAEPECEDAWAYSISWQDAMFDYMHQGYTVKDAFDQAHADYPMCGNCMRFFGDDDFAVVPIVRRNVTPSLWGGYVTPEAGTIDTIFTYFVSYDDADGDMPLVASVYIDGQPYEMSREPHRDFIFAYQTSLSPGSHDYYFYFDDGCGACRLPDSGVFIGPDVNPQFIRGDVDANGAISVFDGLQIVYWLGGDADPPSCINAADADDDEDVEVYDALRIFYWVGGGAPPPPAPCCDFLEDCGSDPTPGPLGCDSYFPCGTRSSDWSQAIILQSGR